ncbi:hypothetical protein CDL12_28427 [Handroanthus impetiginosus]|uniref:DUF8040 domain-containing protein n=1 Tax=Handroanthus impetiginosus TaxID=429701 RepID=A0A2G9G199_9LAMI|nr:hypothetical protein CDL12_28427 [Handroanthus impetiginosus]
MGRRCKIHVLLWLNAFMLRCVMLDYIKHLSKLVELNNRTCINNLYMDRNVFLRLCYLLENLGGLHDKRFVTIHEKVACFLLVLDHHAKNMVVKHNFKRSRHMISKYFNQTLRVVIRGCLDAIDGTYVKVQISRINQAHYRSRKGATVVMYLQQKFIILACTLFRNFIRTQMEFDPYEDIE